MMKLDQPDVLAFRSKFDPTEAIPLLEALRAIQLPS